ncbi:UDP-N-acetylmuramoyl-L-alanyl-D-glutamate--2,6-diaminopimelate ligase [Kangiella sediminilitoris]|uniref:UDP-N-acetylmuramoyl-L-alanyl-D-glutamate--2,6-diaminopimelate ligase n=1 Tax=Kangiella sediminilitoris TaxID=1144748 RepID=A0A1B3BCC9_9GAMM|nr:UDP-N-acetylmuramoyl-L-alanyl-D-glutamate--2,6-diaminopimelate ligase [Kangiella sediminilitoris]AOE50470.1 UDP-N-acetylmuramyl tripeptide synthetase [Kangiella sediminilitoris]
MTKYLGSNFKPKTLSRVLKGLISKEQMGNLAEYEVAGVCLDSRAVTDDVLFIAYPGHVADGRNYFKQAVEAGAKAIVAEKEGLEEFVDLEHTSDSDVCLLNYQGIPLVAIKDLIQFSGIIAARFYGNPTRKMTVTGITGTNGKTSCCYLLAQALEFLHYPTLMLSTIGNGNPSALQVTQNTTPDAVTLQRICAEYLQQKNHYMTMEVSSHGLLQGRVNGVEFSVALFTNLSVDHLDYHGDMESYFQAKRQLFLKKDLKAVVINADDEYGCRLLQDSEIKCEKIAYSQRGEDKEIHKGHWITSENTYLSLQGIKADLHTPWGSAKLHSSLLGQFNLSNIMAVAGALGAMLGDSHKWIVALNSANSVPGRMQKFSGTGKPTIVVDYAHTPDALEKALEALRAHCSEGEVWAVFGCGGDRDNSKRPIMGKVAESHADKVIITDDNPRTEERESIVEMIRKGMANQETPYISSRLEAIKYALENAGPKDMILVAGKGHEDYQVIGTEKIHYSDLESVAELMEVTE